MKTKGNGKLLKAMWQQDVDEKKAFWKDQSRNGRHSNLCISKKSRYSVLIYFGMTVLIMSNIVLFRVNAVFYPLFKSGFVCFINANNMPFRLLCNCLL